jgi:hypothetical protein
MTPDQWEMLQNDIATAIDDSMDIDWNADNGARAVVDMLIQYGYEIKPRAFKPGDRVWVDGPEVLWTIIHIHDNSAWLSHTDDKGFTSDLISVLSELYLKVETK